MSIFLKEECLLLCLRDIFSFIKIDYYTCIGVINVDDEARAINSIGNLIPCISNSLQNVLNFLT